MYFIETILPLALSNTFTYQVTYDEFQFISVGFRVAVPFGKNKIYTAIVVQKHQKPPLSYDPKEIHQIIDISPTVSEVQLQFWKWLAEYYMCAIGEVYRAALPTSLLLESETIIKQKREDHKSKEGLTDQEYLIVEAFQKQSILTISEVATILDQKKVVSVIKSLLEKGWLEIDEKIEEVYKPKLEKYIRLTPDYQSEDGLQKIISVTETAPKQRELVLAYFKFHRGNENEPLSYKKLLNDSGISSSIANTLVKKEVFEIYYIQKDRISYAQESESDILPLTSHQQTAVSQIKQVFKEKNVCLLHGVTASGKTHVYLKLIQDCVQTNKQVLFLVPETILTTQVLQFFQKYFGKEVILYNSKFNNNERVEIWNSIQTNQSKIIIGTRSAIFLPFKDLGLVIVDEEHEQNHKQSQPAPRFHARDSAIVLAQLFQSKVVLGSATPSMESYYNTQINKFGLVQLTEKFESVSDPMISLVDLKEKYKRKQMNGNFSFDLIEKINEKLTQKEQVILFQNRRGYSPIIECESCGHIPQCTQCNVSLTYHKHKNQMRCHYCGFSMGKPSHCHVCTSIDIKSKGFGTEQIELEAKELFPNARIARMDRDTTMGKFAFEKLLDNLNQGNIDILIGTQMLAKGIDIDNITLVGVLNTDTMLYYPDFRSYEKTYQMLVQVSGRSGRKKQGEVIFQTYSPNHLILKQAIQKDYQGFYNLQKEEREVFKYAPFYKLIKIVLKHKDFETLKEASLWYYHVLKQNLKTPVFGPEEPAVNRIKNQYIRVIQIKIKSTLPLKNVKEIILKTDKSFNSISQYRSVKTIIDVDYQ